jgi:succinoglycan biosynthesis protein ExoA
MTLPSTLIVIPTLNESRTIRQVVMDLMAGLPESDHITLVVADGGSTDGTQDMVRALMTERPQLRLVRNPKRLQSAAVNLAVQQFGQGREVLVRCDAHAHYPARFIERLLATLSQAQADAVVVPMDSIGDTPLRQAIAWVSDTPVGSGGSAHRGGKRSGFVDHGHHAAFRMESFCKAGGYDESFSHNEDAELDCRQTALGSRIYLDSDIRIGYLPRAELSGLWRQYSNYGVGRSRTIRKHPGSMRMRQLAVPLHFLLCVLALLMSPWWPWALLWPALYLSVLAATALMLSLRHGSIHGLLAAPAAFTMHMAWALGFFHGMLAHREAPWSASAVKRLLSPGSPASPRGQP